MKEEVSSTEVKVANLKLYNDLSPVGAEHTTNYKRSGGFKGTMINAQWRLKRLTEVFGPVGKGWGYEIKEQWSEMECAFVRLNLWYTIAGAAERFWTGEQIGGTSFAYTPDEAFKMSVTDALGKCASQIGLGADVYAGEIDKPYVLRILPAEQQIIQDLLDETGANKKAFLKMFQVSDLSELTIEDAPKALERAQLKKKQMLKKAELFSAAETLSGTAMGPELAKQVEETLRAGDGAPVVVAELDLGDDF